MSSHESGASSEAEASQAFFFSASFFVLLCLVLVKSLLQLMSNIEAHFLLKFFRWLLKMKRLSLGLVHIPRLHLISPATPLSHPS